MDLKQEQIVGKKRNYEEAMGYANDYQVVQQPELRSIININININDKMSWIDAYCEQCHTEN
jgi:hypothetical protein